MEKRTFVEKLTQIITNPELSVDLYFVFKSGDVHIQYITDPNDDLRKELISGFSEELTRYIDENNNYEVANIYDDNEYEDYHLFYDTISNNANANSIFNFDKANALNYTKEVGGLSRIYGFLIEISNGVDILSIYKRSQHTNALNPRKVINFMSGIDNKFKLIKSDTIYFNRQVDVFKIDDIVFINNRNVYEHHFGFVAELKKKAENSYINLLATNAFEFEQELQTKLSKLTKNELKKLSNCIKENPIIDKANYIAVIRQARRYAKHEFATNSQGKIIIKTLKELRLLISILNRDYNLNDATKERFLTRNKKLIK